MPTVVMKAPHFETDPVRLAASAIQAGGTYERQCCRRRDTSTAAPTTAAAPPTASGAPAETPSTRRPPPTAPSAIPTLQTITISPPICSNRAGSLLAPQLRTV